jgi:hypothetical protein
VDPASFEEGEDTVPRKGLAHSREKANVRRRNPRSRFAILHLHFVDETWVRERVLESTSFGAN